MKMKRTFLFLVLVSSVLTVSVMAGQYSNEGKKYESLRPFDSFVSQYRNSKLTERIGEYRAKIDDLVKQGKTAVFPMDSVYGLMREIAGQEDFEALELLAKDLPLALEMQVWESVAVNNHTKDAQALLVKWAIENPTVPLLMRYLPNGVELLIEMAENKNAPPEDRAMCLNLLGTMPAAITVLTRIKALMSDQSVWSWSGLGGEPETISRSAGEAVKSLEAKKLQENNPIS
jgi:hypothetical protein